MQKKVLFSQNFMSFYRNIFKYVGGESAIFAENMNKVGVCIVSKKVQFSQPFEVKLKIKNLSSEKKEQ